MIDIAPVAAFVTEFFTWLLDVNKITVLATTASALFAGAICWVNWRQLRHTRNVERAYISGGGPLDKNDPNIFKAKAFVEKVDEIWNLVRIEAIKAQGGRA